MVQVLGPRAGVTGLIATLSKWGAQIIDVPTGSASTGVMWQFNVANGTGGWIAVPINYTAGLGLEVLLPTQFIDLTTATEFIVRIGSPSPVVALNMLAASGTTRAAGRLLVSGGGVASDNWIDPQFANNRILTTAVNLVMTGGLVIDKEATVLCTAGGITITLPSPAGLTTRRATVKDRNGNATASPITINVTGGSTIDGAASATIAANYGALNFQCDGTNWFTVN